MRMHQVSALRANFIDINGLRTQSAFIELRSKKIRKICILLLFLDWIKIYKISSKSKI